MNLLSSITLGFLAALASFGAYAQDAGLSKQYTTCMTKSDGVTAAVIDCITTEHKLQDARLNKAYKALMSDIAPPRKKQLQEAQRAWIKFRDANCNFYDDPNGGSMARVSANDCMLSSTTSRAHELEVLKE